MIRLFYRWRRRTQSRSSSPRVIGHHAGSSGNSTHCLPSKRQVMERSSFGKYERRLARRLWLCIALSIPILIFIAWFTWTSIQGLKLFQT